MTLQLKEPLFGFMAIQHTRIGQAGNLMIVVATKTVEYFMVVVVIVVVVVPTYGTTLLVQILTLLFAKTNCF